MTAHRRLTMAEWRRWSFALTIASQRVPLLFKYSPNKNKIIFWRHKKCSFFCKKIFSWGKVLNAKIWVVEKAHYYSNTIRTSHLIIKRHPLIFERFWCFCHKILDSSNVCNVIHGWTTSLPIHVVCFRSLFGKLQSRSFFKD